MTPTTELNRKTTGRELWRTGQSVSHGVALGVCCFLSYKIIIGLITLLRFVPRDDELLGGMWAVVATIFVFRYSYEESVHAALSRISATIFSFALNTRAPRWSASTGKSFRRIGPRHDSVFARN